MWADDPSSASRALAEGSDIGKTSRGTDEFGETCPSDDILPPPPPSNIWHEIGQKPSKHIHLHSFRANPFSVRDAIHAVQPRIECLLRVEDAWTLELVLAEIMNNIVEHGYANTGEGTISLAMALQGDELICTIGDFGPELPATCLGTEIKPPEPADLPDGGFGWFLIRDLAQDLRYDREEGRNWLTLRFPLAKPDQFI
ncbi:MAG TPA: ATP-binding protein [Paenirhodobacter sp.]